MLNVGIFSLAYGIIDDAIKKYKKLYDFNKDEINVVTMYSLK